MRILPCPFRLIFIFSLFVFAFNLFNITTNNNKGLVKFCLPFLEIESRGVMSDTYQPAPQWV